MEGTDGLHGFGRLQAQNPNYNEEEAENARPPAQNPEYAGSEISIDEVGPSAPSDLQPAPVATVPVDRSMSAVSAVSDDFIGSAHSASSRSDIGQVQNNQTAAASSSQPPRQQPAASSSSAPPPSQQDAADGWDTERGQGSMLMLQTRQPRGFSWFFGIGSSEARIMLRDPSMFDGTGTVLCTFRDRESADAAMPQIASAINSNLSATSNGEDLQNLYNELKKNKKMRDLLLVGIVGLDGPSVQTSTSGGAGSSTATENNASNSAAAHENCTDASHNHGHGHDHTEPEVDRTNFTDGDDCPICMESIDNVESALRCSAAGGQFHYFHNHCLRDWIRSCRQAGNVPTCPICRGAIEINRRRMQGFINSGMADTWDEEERNFLQNMIKMAGASEDWQEVFTTENLQTAGAIIGAAGWGFYSGWSQRPYS